MSDELANRVERVSKIVSSSYLKELMCPHCNTLFVYSQRDTFNKAVDVCDVEFTVKLVKCTNCSEVINGVP